MAKNGSGMSLASSRGMHGELSATERPRTTIPQPRVLVVEPNGLLRNAMCRALAAQGADVCGYGSTLEACRHARQSRFDVVVTRADAPSKNLLALRAAGDPSGDGLRFVLFDRAAGASSRAADLDRVHRLASGLTGAELLRAVFSDPHSA